MTNSIRYGRTSIISIDGDTLIVEEEKIQDYVPMIKLYRNTTRVFAANRKQVLAEMLKLADKLDEEDVIDINFECKKRSNSTKRFEIEVTWTSK